MEWSAVWKKESKSFFPNDHFSENCSVCCSKKIWKKINLEVPWEFAPKVTDTARIKSCCGKNFHWKKLSKINILAKLNQKLIQTSSPYMLEYASLFYISLWNLKDAKPSQVTAKCALGWVSRWLINYEWQLGCFFFVLKTWFYLFKARIHEGLL